MTANALPTASRERASPCPEEDGRESKEEMGRALSTRGQAGGDDKGPL